MTAEEYRRVEDIFREAYRLPAEERSRYVRDASGANISIRECVEDLLADPGAALALVRGIDSERSPRPHANTASPRSSRPPSPAPPPIAPPTASAPPAAEEADIVDSIPGYRILDTLGRGTHTIVYRGIPDLGEPRMVAVKVNLEVGRTQGFLRRFYQTRQQLEGLKDPRIANLLDAGTTADGRPYLVMDYIGGHPLLTWEPAQNRSVRDVAEIFLKLCAVVQKAHQHLAVHLNLKPSNILLETDGTAALLDLGVVQILRLPPSHDYASPEQMEGGQITLASDVYALGLLLFELLTGQKARQNGGPPASTPSLFNPKVPRDLDAVVRKALAMEPRDRYTSADQMAEDVHRFLENLPVRAQSQSFSHRATRFARRNRWILLAGTAALLALAAVTGWLVGRSLPQ